MVMGVILGLQSPFVKRLLTSWALVDRDLIRKFDDLRDIFSAIGNFSRYRKLVSEMRTGHAESVPASTYLGVLFRDLIYLHDSAPSLIGPNQTLVNLTKIFQIDLAIQRWHVTVCLAPKEKTSSINIVTFLSAIEECAQIVPEWIIKDVSHRLEQPTSIDIKSINTLVEVDNHGNPDVILRKLKGIVLHFDQSPFAEGVRELRIRRSKSTKSLTSAMRMDSGSMKNLNVTKNDAELKGVTPPRSHSNTESHSVTTPSKIGTISPRNIVTDAKSPRIPKGSKAMTSPSAVSPPLRQVKMDPNRARIRPVRPQAVTGQEEEIGIDDGLVEEGN